MSDQIAMVLERFARRRDDFGRGENDGVLGDYGCVDGNKASSTPNALVNTQAIAARLFDAPNFGNIVFRNSNRIDHHGICGIHCAGLCKVFRKHNAGTFVGHRTDTKETSLVSSTGIQPDVASVQLAHSQWNNYARRSAYA